jgi:hypothetical protein
MIGERLQALHPEGINRPTPARIEVNVCRLQARRHIRQTRASSR